MCLETARILAPNMKMVARDDKVKMTQSYRPKDFRKLRAEVDWFDLPTAKNFMACVKYGIRRPKNPPDTSMVPAMVPAAPGQLPLALMKAVAKMMR